jgi:hypothetical protein
MVQAPEIGRALTLDKVSSLVKMAILLVGFGGLGWLVVVSERKMSVEFNMV